VLAIKGINKKQKGREKNLASLVLFFYIYKLYIKSKEKGL